MSTPDDNSSGNTVVLLGDEDSSGSEAEAHGCGLLGENAPAYEGFFDSPEAAIDSTTPTPLSGADMCAPY